MAIAIKEGSSEERKKERKTEGGDYDVDLGPIAS